MAALHLLMLSCTLSAALALRPPDPLVVGASECAVYTFAKLQRAAQLPGAGFRGPKAFGAAEKELQSVLWSQFGMANAAAYDLADRSRLNQLRNIEGGKVVSAGLDALLFLDTFPSAQKQFSVPFFGKKATAATPPPLDQDALQLAAAKGMTHAYIALTSSTELADCVAFLRSQCPDLMATVVVPEAGVRVECRSGWNSLLAQDLGGELVDGLCVRDGLVQMEEGAELRAIAPELPASSATLATQDLSELLVQLALRTPRSADDCGIDGCDGDVRVVRVAPAAGAFVPGSVRPGSRVKLGGLVGEKNVKLNGEVATVMDQWEESFEAGEPGWVVLTDAKLSNGFIGSLKRIKEANLQALDPYADWESLLAPFGSPEFGVKTVDPDDGRLLIPEWGPFGAKFSSDVSSAVF